MATILASAACALRSAAGRRTTIGGMVGIPVPGFLTGMTATPFDPHALLAESRLGVLATIKADGRPQLSPVMPFYDRAAGVIYVSMRAGLAKTANLRRDARATLEVTSPDGRAWATAEGTATLTGPGSDPTDRRSRHWWTTTGSPPVSTPTGTSTARPWCRTVEYS